MRQTNKIRKGIAWLLCTVLVLGILLMYLPQYNADIMTEMPRALYL